MALKEKPHEPTSRIRRRYVVGVAVALILVAFAGIDLQPYFEYRAKKNKIRELVPVGSNIDDAGPILKQHGFRYYPKHFATVAEDKYWIDVTVAHQPRPITLTALEFLGVRAYFHYVVIEAGLDNKVRKIF